MNQYRFSNAPAEVQAQIRRLATACRAALNDNLAAMYLHGSLALGCFNPASSDIDMLVVSRTGITPKESNDLIQLMLTSSRNPIDVELSVVVESRLRPWSFPTPYAFHYSEKWRQRFQEMQTLDDLSGADEDLAAHFVLVHRYGIILHGLPPGQILPQVPWTDFERSLLADFRWASERIHDNPRRVLDMCRAYCQIRTRRLSSKDEAAVWCMTIVPDELRPVVQQALDVYRGDRNVNESSFEELERFREVFEEFMRLLRRPEFR